MQTSLTKDEALIALGANLPNGHETSKDILKRVIVTFKNEMTVKVASNLYQTPSFPVGNGPDFINACLKITWPGESVLLLNQLHEIESRFGRTRNQRWAPRVVDIDLLAHGNAVCPNIIIYNQWRLMPLEQQATKTPTEMIVPHPRIQDRAFVLGPLRDVAPQWVHPVIGKSVQQMWNDLPQADRDAIIPL